MNMFKLARNGLIAGLFALLPFAAQAGLMVTIDDVTNGVGVDFSIADGDAGDLSGDAGNLGFFSTFGASSLLVGVNSDAPSTWFLNDTQINFSLAAGASFIITVTDDSYALGAGTTHSFNTVTNSSNIGGLDVSVTTTVDGNTVFSGAITDNSNYTGVSSVTLASDPFSIEHVYTVANNTGSTVSSFTIDTTTAVPEPTSLILFSLSLIGMALIRKKYYAV